MPLGSNPTKIDYYVVDERAVFRAYLVFAVAWQVGIIVPAAVAVAIFDWSSLWLLVAAFLCCQMMGFRRFKEIVDPKPVYDSGVDPWD